MNKKKTIVLSDAEFDKIQMGPQPKPDHPYIFKGTVKEFFLRESEQGADE